MKTLNTMSSKPARAFGVKNALGLLLMAVGLILQAFWPRHSPQYDVSFGFYLVGAALWPSGKYLYLPVLLLLFAVLFSLGKNGLQTPSIIAMALAGIIGFYGWWENKKGKASDGRSA
jgi:hypothetical protein